MGARRPLPLHSPAVAPSLSIETPPSPPRPPGPEHIPCRCYCQTCPGASETGQVTMFLGRKPLSEGPTQSPASPTHCPLLPHFLSASHKGPGISPPPPPPLPRLAQWGAWLYYTNSPRIPDSTDKGESSGAHRQPSVMTQLRQKPLAGRGPEASPAIFLQRCDLEALCCQPVCSFLIFSSSHVWL